MPKITIDGKEFEAKDGATVIQTCADNGIDIGHYCWHPGLSPEGNCRMCLVEVEKAPKLMPSCMTTVNEGMVVSTQHTSEKVRDAQRDVMEFLLVDHPIDCPICDQAGECKLQDYYMKYDRQPSQVPLDSKVHKPKRQKFSDQVTYDAERCILCTRCVRFCREIEGKEELGMINRGAVSLISLYNDEAKLSGDYQVNIVDICPVGALTHSDFRFKKRVWFMDYTPSICAGCSRGCNVTVGSHNAKVYRYKPRENQDVNQWWMCDEGRLTYKQVHAEGRVLKPRLRGGADASEYADWRRVLDRSADVLKLLEKKEGPQAVAAIGSPLASTEENYLLKKLFAAHFPGAKVAFPAADLYKEGSADKLLKTGDKAPNARAGAALGLTDTIESVIEGIEAGTIKALYLLGDDLAATGPLAERFAKAAEKLQWLVVQSPYYHATAQRAHAVLAAAHHLESQGTFINFEGRVQRFAPAIRPQVEARTGVQILQDVAAALGAEIPGGTGAQVFDALAAEEKQFSGLSWGALGDQGAKLGQ